MLLQIPLKVTCVSPPKHEMAAVERKLILKKHFLKKVFFFINLSHAALIRVEGAER